MKLMRWAASAGLLLSAGMLANCSQIFGSGDSGEGITTAMLVGADGDSANWISHGRTYSEQRFSPLDGVNRENVGQLGLAWYADMDTGRGQEATPLVIDGKLYLNYNDEIQGRWEQDIPGHITRANGNWPNVLSR